MDQTFKAAREGAAPRLASFTIEGEGEEVDLGVGRVVLKVAEQRTVKPRQMKWNRRDRISGNTIYPLVKITFSPILLYSGMLHIYVGKTAIHPTPCRTITLIQLTTEQQSFTALVWKHPKDLSKSRCCILVLRAPR